MAINQAYLFLIFALNGFVIGLLFDFFRILRKSFKTADIITYIEDILFWILSGLTVLYSIFDGQGRPLMQNISWDTFKRPKSGQSGGQYNIGDSDNYLKYIIDAEYKYGIVLTVPSQLPSTDYKYTLNIVIKYESGKTNVLEAQLVVIDDAIPVLSRKQNDLVSAIDTKYEEINQNTLNHQCLTLRLLYYKHSNV